MLIIIFIIIITLFQEANTDFLNILLDDQTSGRSKENITIVVVPASNVPIWRIILFKNYNWNLFLLLIFYLEYRLNHFPLKNLPYSPPDVSFKFMGLGLSI